MDQCPIQEEFKVTSPRENLKISLFTKISILIDRLHAYLLAKYQLCQNISIPGKFVNLINKQSHVQGKCLPTSTVVSDWAKLGMRGHAVRWLTGGLVLVIFIASAGSDDINWCVNRVCNHTSYRLRWLKCLLLLVSPVSMCCPER